MTTVPSQIKLTGLPFMFQGWNEEFKFTGRTTLYEGKNYPIYRLDPYRLYCCYLIAGAEIRMSNKGLWSFWKDGYEYPLFYKGDAMNFSSPTGWWSPGVYVYDTSEYP